MGRQKMAAFLATSLAPGNNGIGRYVCQLKRLTFNYCKTGGSSGGMRKYLEQNVVPFAEKTPEVAMYVRHRASRHPRLVAEYLNQQSKIVCVKNMTVEEIEKWVWQLRAASGAKVEKLKKPWHTERPSIQGNWNPFLNH